MCSTWILADWDLRSDRNESMTIQQEKQILADWDLRSDRNRDCPVLERVEILADWDLRSDRNNLGAVNIAELF